nr:insulin-like protein [Fasciola gigantica]
MRKARLFRSVSVVVLVHLVSAFQIAGLLFQKETDQLPQEHDVSSANTRVKRCGQTLLQNLRGVCGTRGVYTPAGRIRRALDYGNYIRFENQMLEGRPRQTRLCSIYILFKPNDVVTQCCCHGCTQSYLERFCNAPES